MPVVEDSDQVLPLLKVGDEVTTDEGPGVLVGVQFQTAQYNGKWELEPPQLEVDLDSGKTIYTCLCSIELPNTQKGTKLIHQEFNRLWPPKDENVPEDSEMLIPEGDEEPQEEVVREGSERTATMQYRANALLDIDDEQMVRAANELFREEDLDPEDFQAETHYLSGIWIQPIGQAWGPEFVLVESYDEAIKMAEEKVREDLENEPELFNKDWLIHYIREDKLRGELDEINSIYDDLAYEIDLRPEDAAEQMDVDPDDFIDQDGYIDETALRVHLTDMLDDYAEREARARRDEYIKKAINWGGIDYFKAAENAVNTDGPGHFLAHYDGEIRELPSGAVYFRTN